MNAILVSFSVFVVLFGGAFAGMGLRRVLPENQLRPEAKEIIRLATGFLVTMTALVLGILVSTANSSYQARENQLTEMASQFVVVDRLLDNYGPETRAEREELRRLMANGLERVWPSQASRKSQLRPTDDSQLFYERLQLLTPKSDTQASVKAAAISAALGIRHTYWLMFLGSEQSALSIPLLAVVVAWLACIFISFGLYAPLNHTVMVTLASCASAVSAAVFLIMEMYTPFSGLLRISSLPLREALIRMGP